MKKIISIISLVLLLALSLTACGGKADYKENAKTYEFDKLKIELTESFDAGKREIKEGDSSLGVTYTSKTYTTVTVMKEEANTAAFILANNDIAALKKSIPDMDHVTVTINKITSDGVESETADIETKAGTATYYVYTVKESTGEYTYLKAFLNKSEYSYSITFSVTKAAYEGKKDDGYKNHFMTWLKTADITIPESSD